MRPPNILLTIADDQRATALGCRGVEKVRTPHLDALAGRGVRFDRAYHFGSPHGAVCAPSRAMLHTGRPHYELDRAIVLHGGTGPKSIPPLLGQRLRDAGYDTFVTGKWHNGPETLHASFSSGAGIFFGGMDDHWFTPVQDYDPTGQYPAARARVGEAFSTEVFARRAIEFIRSRQRDDRPFFCYCAFTAPHDPRTPPDDYRRMYPVKDIELPPNARPRPPFSMPMRDEELLGLPRDRVAVQREIAAYYGMLTHMDAWIGRIHAALAETGLLENTLVVHTADHGLGVGQHGLLGKQNVYEHSIGVPLVMAGPGIAAGGVSEALVYQHDLNPTLLQAAGLTPGTGPFQSLFSPSPRASIGSHYAGHARSVRDDRYKLIDYMADGRRELYDLAADPWETTNLFADAAHRPHADRLAPSLPAGPFTLSS